MTSGISQLRVPRSVKHPGPTSTERAVVVPVGAIAIDEVLPSGMRLLDALASLLERRGVESAALMLSEGGFGPFAYVIPSLSPDNSQVAFYSGTFRPADVTRLDQGTVTVGYREGKPFFHCHARWTEFDGQTGCGHVLPDETVIAIPIRVTGAGIIGARFEIHADAETGFNLFVPRATKTTIPSDARRAVAVRIAPNQDLIETLEKIGHAANFRRAVVRGGVASTLNARFVEPSPFVDFATELFVRRGLIRCSPDAGAATELDIVVVDLHGTVASGRLIAGDNPVLMTFEGVMEDA